MRRQLVVSVLVAGGLAGGLLTAAPQARADCMMGCMPMPNPPGSMSNSMMPTMMTWMMPSASTSAVAGVSTLPSGLVQVGLVAAGSHTVSVLEMPGLAVGATANANAISLTGPAGASVYLTDMAHTYVVTLDGSGAASVAAALFGS